MKLIWKGGTSRSGMAQWALFGAVAVVIGLLAFVLAAFGLVVGAILAGMLALFAGPVARRRPGAFSVYAAHVTPDDRAKPGEGCVELGKDAYNVRIVDEKNAVE